jgi:hypothetical protein
MAPYVAETTTQSSCLTKRPNPGNRAEVIQHLQVLAGIARPLDDTKRPHPRTFTGDVMLPALWS